MAILASFDVLICSLKLSSSMRLKTSRCRSFTELRFSFKGSNSHGAF
uniref:Uncharacterized protein n=1 Tax=uncultured delta proteobacterium HF0200_39N20 TaxID=710833 RepID=E0XUS8_9DELT|nr:hypothetical protein [uncultured delta proteobacterium HF0200_39N20]